MTSSTKSNDKQDYYSIDIRGKLTGSNIMEITKVVECGLKMNHKVLLFDLRKMYVIDSRGIGFLTNLHKELQKLGGKICLASLQPNISNIIQTCGLHKVIDIYDDISEAKQALSSGASIEQKGFYAIITLPEKLDLIVIETVRKEINKNIAEGYNHIVVDFKDNRLITSIGIGALINLHKKLKERKGDLYLLNISSDIKTLLEEANILKVLSEYKTLEEIEEKIL